MPHGPPNPPPPQFPARPGLRGDQGSLLPPVLPRAGPGPPAARSDGSFSAGRDEASSLEVTWPDGRVVARAVASSETNSVLEIPYPQGVEGQLPPTPLECGQGFSQHENGRCADTDECAAFPFVCPREKPLCTNTYGGYRCRSNRRCSRGFEPSEDGTACVGECRPGETQASPRPGAGRSGSLGSLGPCNGVSAPPAGPAW
uniref:EGF-like calcium-binding domain-containing protein n=1 Tax=Chelydra serpentina TaxID=8475 RepID=A0A8C3XLI3_CHESE